jgi:hypothetical protein
MKKILAISLVLALALTLLMPSVAMAARPAEFSASGVFNDIDQGKVKPLGNSGKWLVTDRHIQGEFLPDGALEGDFTLTYGGVFNITDQSGHLAGRLSTDAGTFAITGETKPLEVLDYIILEDGTIFPTLCKLSVTGRWTGLKSINANGKFESWFTFDIDAEGHVVNIYDSSFEMTGKYLNKR